MQSNHPTFYWNDPQLKEKLTAFNGDPTMFLEEADRSAARSQAWTLLKKEIEGEKVLHWEYFTILPGLPPADDAATEAAVLKHLTEKFGPSAPFSMGFAHLFKFSE